MVDVDLHAPLRGLSLCAGVGMLDEGVAAAFAYFGRRYRCVAYVERDAYATAALVARMEDQALAPAPVWDDLTTFPGRAFRGAVDCVVAGFPCTDLSVAGARAGLDGARSGLFFEVLRVASDCDARFLLLENVSGITSAGAALVDETGEPRTERAVARVVGELADRGWSAEWLHLPASAVGASHRRERWFALAWRAVYDTASPRCHRAGSRAGADQQARDARTWPTLVANDDNKSPAAHLAMKRRMKGGARSQATSLQVATRLWPTPLHSEARQGFQDRSRGKKVTQEGLTTIILKPLWRTPYGFQAGNGPDGKEFSTVTRQWATPDCNTSSYSNGQFGMNLRQQADLWATPNTARRGTEASDKKAARRATSGGGCSDLLTQSEHWSTPKGSDGHKCGPNQRGSNGDLPLPALAAKWENPSSPQAPQTRSGEPSSPADPGLRPPAGQQHCESAGTPPAAASSKKRLNPAFANFLMGWPWWWTNTAPINSAAQEMALYRCKLRVHLSSLCGAPEWTSDDP